MKKHPFRRTAEEKTEASGDSWEEDEELKLYGTADQDVDENGPGAGSSFL